MVANPAWVAGPPLPDDLERVLAEARRRDLIGPAPLADQVTHSAGFASFIGEGSRVIDLGSGGGLPGLALAVGRPDLDLTLVDSATRRIRFLEWAIGELGVRDRVRAVWGRAEDLGRDDSLRETFTHVVSRSFGKPAVTAECGRAFLAPGGVMVVSEPPPADRLEVRPGSGQASSTGSRWPRPALAELGLRVVEASPGQNDRYGFQLLEADGPCPALVPRRAGRPAKRPLF